MTAVRGLVKRYGATAAVNDLNFTIRPGRVTGFLGPNGAGQTTTMRQILSPDRPSAAFVTHLGPRPALATRMPGCLRCSWFPAKARPGAPGESTH
jgi:ABC-2 type transport system ATP-binding protein